MCTCKLLLLVKTEVIYDLSLLNIDYMLKYENCLLYKVFTKMKEIKDILKNFGISPNETRVYLAMLKLGDAPVSRIAQVAKLNRITVHHIVERLEKEGLAVSFKKEKQKLVRGAHPVSLKNKIKESAEMFEKVVPELVATMRDDMNKTKPIVRMHYGVEGFEKVAGELLEKPNITIRHIGSLAEAHKIIGVKYDKEYFVPTRVSRNIHYKTLQYADEGKPVMRTNDADDLREVRLLPPEFKVSANTFIVPGKILIVTTDKELMSVVIESVDISNSEIEKFDLIWNLLGEKSRSPY